MFDNYKRFHFIGIGGIGMSAIAEWMILDVFLKLDEQKCLEN